MVDRRVKSAETGEIYTISSNIITRNKDYSFILADADLTLYYTSASDYTWTIPPQSVVNWPNGIEIHFTKSGGGNLTIARGSGVALYTAGTATDGNVTLTTGYYFSAYITKVSDDVWILEYGSAEAGAVRNWSSIIDDGGKPSDYAGAGLIFGTNDAAGGIQGNTLTKINANGWDTHYYSLQAWKGAASLSFIPNQTNLDGNMGINTDPLTDASYTSLDYSWQTSSDGNTYIRVAGSLDGAGSYGTYTTSDVFELKYNGHSVVFLINGVVKKTITGLSNGILFFFDSSFYHQGFSVRAVTFTPYGSSNWADVDGDGVPDDYADVTLTKLSQSTWTYDLDLTVGNSGGLYGYNSGSFGSLSPDQFYNKLSAIVVISYIYYDIGASNTVYFGQLGTSQSNSNNNFKSIQINSQTVLNRSAASYTADDLAGSTQWAWGSVNTSAYPTSGAATLEILTGA